MTDKNNVRSLGLQTAQQLQIKYGMTPNLDVADLVILEVRKNGEVYLGMNSMSAERQHYLGGVLQAYALGAIGDK